MKRPLIKKMLKLSEVRTTFKALDTETPPASEEGDEAASANPGGQEDKPKKPGRRKGTPGDSRQVQLPLSGAYSHPPEHCVVWGQPLEAGAFIARTGWYVLEVEAEPESRLQGVRVRHDKHLYGEITCRCGHLNRSEPGRCAKEPMWEVALTEWHWVGPRLASLIVCLSQRMHLSRRRIQEFLRDWLGIALGTSTLNQCIHEAGRAVEPLEEQLVEELQEAHLAHADETPWKEWGHERLAVFRKWCEQHRDSTHEKTRALAREFLNDWEAIGCVLAHPYLPLTNNEAELRHRVILRRISQGTRTEQGSRVFALLASVIDTCRKRHLLLWPYLAQVIAERRKGNPAPPLPAAA
jgi:hypothetical protein